MELISIGLLAALVGLASGVVLGMAARLGEFCTLGAIESAFYGGNQTRARMWGIALGVAILGTFILVHLNVLSLGSTFYHSIQWNPFASIFGGLMFGYGMAYAGNCGFSALARIGGGDLRALVAVIVLAIFSLITLGGPLAELRVFLFPEIASDGPQGFTSLFSDLTSLPPIIIAAAISALLILWALAYPGLRAQPRSIFWGVMVGLAITGGWWGTSTLAHSSFDAIPVQNHSFTAPLGRSLIYLLTSSAGGINFSVGSVAGVALGGFIGSLIKGHFRWEACEDPQELGRQMFGAALMGIGGVIALGCSIGQGLTAFSTLAYSAPVTLGAIVVGALIGLKRLVAGFQPE